MMVVMKDVGEVEWQVPMTKSRPVHDDRGWELVESKLE